MAKLKLPFELEKPSSNEYVTQASEIGYNDNSVADTLTQQGYKIAKSATTAASEMGGALDIVDPDGNVLARFEDGDFAVKNFNSADIKVEKVNGKNVLYLGK